MGRIHKNIESWLESEREQIGLWVPVALGIGICAWFAMPQRDHWISFCFLMLAVASLGYMAPPGSRSRLAIVVGALLCCAGCILVWGKASLFDSEPLRKPVFVTVVGKVVGVRPMPAMNMTRVVLSPIESPALPPLIRVNVADIDKPEGLGKGAVLQFRVRLMPPADASVVGGYNFARRAYFDQIGATGKALRPIRLLLPAEEESSLRHRMFDHIRTRIEPGPAGIAAALATGEQSAISEQDAEAMRRSGLAHLLSISGLHVTAFIAAVIFLIMRLFALSSYVALRMPLMLVAASCGALAGIAYTLFTGAEVPTIRSCIASLLVLGGLAMGREAVTLRLVATGALIVLFFWPEAMIGPSFQMSFGSVVALVALGELPQFRAFMAPREEEYWRKVGRFVVATLLTGLVVEIVLAPVSLWHFHKAGLLGSIANLIAIPLTTFVVMPLEALALILDVVGLGWPAWWLTERALAFLLFIAHSVASHPASLMMVPSLPDWAFAVMMGGIMWTLLWRTQARWLGCIPAIFGIAVMIWSPTPDILVTGDGGHLAIRTNDGRMAILRERAGEYVRNSLSESAGYGGELVSIESLPEASCSPDLCAVNMRRDGRVWRILATRSAYHVDRPLFERDCAQSDIVISPRRLPNWCQPRWLRVDRQYLRENGGLSINLERELIRTVIKPDDMHPWAIR